MKRHVDIHYVRVSQSAAERPDCAGGRPVERWNVHLRIPQQASQPRLPRAAAPRLGDDPGRHIDRQSVLQRATKERSDTRVTSLDGE
jgi:hypothetical protein